MVDNPLIKAVYFLPGVAFGGVPLGFHDDLSKGFGEESRQVLLIVTTPVSS